MALRALAAKVTFLHHLLGIVPRTTGTLAAVLGTYVSDKITGKKTKSNTSITGRIAKNATGSVTRTITRDILGNIMK